MEEFKVLETMAGFDREVAKELVKAAMDKIKNENITDPKEQQALKQQAIANSLSAVFIRAEDEEGPIMYAYKYEADKETREEFNARMKDLFKDMAVKDSSIKKLDINNEELQDALAEYDEAIEAQEMAEDEEISFDNMVLGEADDDFDYETEEAAEEEPVEYADEEVDQQVEEEIQEEKKDYSLAKGLAYGALVAGTIGAIALAARSCGKEEVVEETPVIEQTVEEDEVVVNETQDRIMNEIHEGRIADAEINEDIRFSEEAFNEWLTEDMVNILEQMNLSVDKENPGAFMQIGADEALALNIVYGNWTDEDVAQILGGHSINQADVMEKSNRALEKLMLTSFIRTEENTVDSMDISNLMISATEENLADYKEFQDMLSEYAKLNAEEGKEEEAKEQFINLVHKYNEFGSNTNVDTPAFNTFILKAFGPTLQMICNEHQYTEEFTYTVFDLQTGKDNVEVTDPKAPVFREDMARNLLLGWEGCTVDGIDGPAINVTIHGISGRYAIPMDETKAYVDEFYGGFGEKVDSYNQWIEQLRTENHIGDVGIIGQHLESNPEVTITYVNEKAFGEDKTLVDFINNNSEYDTLMQGTFDYQERIDSINSELVEQNIAENNLDYYRWLASEYFINYKNGYNRNNNGNNQVITNTNENITDIVENSTDPEIQRKAEEARQQFMELYYQTTGRELINPEDEAAYIQQHVNETAVEVQERVNQYNATHDANDQMRVEAVGTAQQMQNAGISIDTSRLNNDGDSYTENVGQVIHEFSYVDPNGNVTQGDRIISNSEQLTDAQRQQAINNAPITYDKEFENAVIESHSVAPQSSSSSSSSSSTTTTTTTVTEGDTGLYDTTTETVNAGTTVVEQNININVNTGDNSVQDTTVVETPSVTETSEDSYTESSSSSEEVETVYTESEGDSGEYTTEDPTSSETFAPVVEEVYGSIMDELEAMEPEDSLSTGRSR